MNITIFGSTSPTGLLATKYALYRGYRVTAYARNATICHSQLKFVVGELVDTAAINSAFQEADAVVSFLGPKGKLNDTQLSEGIQAILQGMKKKRINRFVGMGTASFQDAHDRPGILTRAQVGLLKLLAGGTYREVIRIGQLVRASGLDWTILRVPWLTNRAATGQLYVGYYGPRSTAIP